MSITGSSEVVASGRERGGANEVAAASWITVRAPLESTGIPITDRKLGLGETEAITLAVELAPLAVLLMDDGPARRLANELGVAATGSAGILAEAKRQGLIATVRPLLDDLRTVGLYLSNITYDLILANVGESRQT